MLFINYCALSSGWVVGRLLEAGAEVDKSDKNGTTPLWIAADEGQNKTQC